MPSTEYAVPVSHRAMRTTGRAILRALWHGTLTTLTVLVGLLGGLGWLWELYKQRLLRSGPVVGDALPLLQLAAVDSQPLLRVAIAWVAVGLVIGIALRRYDRVPRAAIAGGVAAVFLWFDSQASNALTRNLRFSDVLAHRSVGAGVWIEAAIFAAACALAPARPRAGARALPLPRTRAETH